MGGIGSAIGGIFGQTGGGEGGVHFDQGAQPIRPDWISALSDPNTGQLKSGYQVQTTPDVNLDMSAANAIQQRALQAPGQSDWGNLMRQQAGIQQAGQRSNLIQQNASDLANAKSTLAQQRGLSGGANERLATNNMRNQASGMQGLGNQAQNNLLNIGTQEAQQQNQAQQQAAQNAMQAGQFQQGQRAFDTGVNQSNVNNALTQLTGQNAANLGAYQSQLQNWASAGQANAMSAGNNRGKK